MNTFLFFLMRVFTLFSLLFICGCAVTPQLQKLEILQIEPSSGPTHGNYPLFIIGHGFDPKAEVKIGNKPVSDISIGQLFLVKVPQGSPGEADVVVINPDNQRAVLKNGFTYQIYPTIKSISPEEGSSNGGTLVTIRGSGFQEDSIVLFDGQQAKVQTAKEKEIQVLSPPHPSGTANVVVTNPGGFSFVLDEAFRYR
jgi:hypothetical protein